MTESAKKMTLALQQAGVPLICGSDAPEWYMVQGFALHLEMEMLSQCGLCNYDKLGTIEKGKEADLLLLDANPLADIRNTRKMAAVLSNGKYYGIEGIQKLLQK